MIETILVLLDLIDIERVYLIVWSDLQDLFKSLCDQS